MPNFSKGKYHNQHDNRGRYQQDPVIRKVSFKNNQRGKNHRGRRGGQGRGFENQMREYFHNEIEEQDFDFQPGPSSYHRGKPISAV